MGFGPSSTSKMARKIALSMVDCKRYAGAAEAAARIGYDIVEESED